MPAKRVSTTSWSSDLQCTIGVGAATGIVLGIVLAALEGGFGTGVGAGRALVLAVYGLTGALLGVGAGVVVWAVSRTGLVRAGTAAVPLGLSLVAAVLTGLFMLRDYTAAGLVDLPGGVATNAIVSVVLWLAIGATGTRIARRREFSVGSAAGRGLLGVTLVLVLVFSVMLQKSRGGVPDADRDIQGPNVLLVVVDAMRPDHLGAYRYYRPTSPRIDELGEGGVVFENAYAHAASVPASLASIFTGAYPCIHGAGNTAALRPSPVTLAERLDEAGYATVAVGTRSLDARSGTGRGFERVETFDPARFRLTLFAAAAGLGWDRPAASLATGHAAGEAVTLAAREWLERLGDRPWFMALHYGDLAAPHLPPPDLFAEYDRQTSRFDASTLYLMTSSLADQPAPLPVKDGEVDRLVDLYDASIRHLDRLIAQLLDRVVEASVMRETVVVLTGGRGEEFMEEGRLYQMNGVAEPVLRVPLIVWATGGLVPTRVGALVRHVDIMPTLCELGGAVPPAGIPGASFAAALGGGPAPRVAESVARSRNRTAITTPEWKIVRTDDTDGFALYDLSADPWAREDVSSRHSDVLDELKRRVQSHDEECRAARNAAR